MDWQAAAGLGAVGGALVEAINLYGLVTSWQAARHRVRICGERRLPRLTAFVDVPADSLVAATRFGLGALAAGLFHAQIAGVAAAIAVGASAPAVLRQLGSVRTLREALAPTAGQVAGSGHEAPVAGAEAQTGTEAHRGEGSG